MIGAWYDDWAEDLESWEGLANLQAQARSTGLDPSAVPCQVASGTRTVHAVEAVRASRWSRVTSGASSWAASAT